MADMLQEWIGRQQEASDEVSLAAIKRLAALLDVPPRPYKRGDAIPKGWYVVLFAPEERQSLLGSDGHPEKGQFIPPVALPRRMFAGRRVGFHDALRIGDEVNRLSRIARIEPKQGRSGKMCFVTVRHEISGPRGLAVVEEHDIVYREEPKPGAPKTATAPAPAAGSAEWTRSIVPDNVLLFRYSAATFNSHRIHYDIDYVRNTEGYPDLVVNGGLMTLLLWELATSKSGRELKSSSSRNLKALFVNRPITVCGMPVATENKARMWALDAEGDLAIEAELELEPG
jgi:3-methylfumaryl-CoA hydratase